MYKPTTLVMIFTVHFLIKLLVQHHTSVISAVTQTILFVHPTVPLQWYLALTGYWWGGPPSHGETLQMTNKLFIVAAG
jgi:hypothetical protein